MIDLEFKYEKNSFYEIRICEAYADLSQFDDFF